MPKKKNNITVGSKVHWRDPAIHDFPKKDRPAILNRVFTVVEIDHENDFALILEDGESVGWEQEVMAHELELV